MTNEDIRKKWEIFITEYSTYFLSNGEIWNNNLEEVKKYIDEHKILWYYEIQTFELSNEMTYTPDFFLPKYEKFIEIKGYMNEESQEKIDKFIEQYPWDLEILYKDDLIKLGDLYEKLKEEEGKNNLDKDKDK